MQEEDKFKCKLCKNAYSYEGTLKTHVMIEHCKNNSYFCDQCEYHDSTQSNISNQIDHTMRDTNHEEVDASNLRTYSKTHSEAPLKKRSRKSKAGPTELACPLCEYTTRVKEHLASHMNSHTNDRKHMCGQCGQIFK